MSTRRIAALAVRVMRQILRDARTIALMTFVPILVLSLGATLFRTDPAPLNLGVVNEDTGDTLPPVGQIAIGERILDRLAQDDGLRIRSVERDEAEVALQDGAIDGMLYLAPEVSAAFLRDGQATIDLHLEGSNPSRSAMLTARVTEAAVQAILSLGVADDVAARPVSVATFYLYAGEAFDTLDFVAPVYIAFLALFFVFLLTCVSFLRERSQGTYERLLATPTTRLEIVMGYMLGLGVFAQLQVALIVFFTVGVLRINYLGSLALLFLVAALLATVGVALGLLASAFARNEFQVVQFIPLLVIPQALLGDVFWAVEDMPAHVQPVARLMPITYANRALRDVMLKGWGLAEIWPDLAVLVGIAAVLLVLGALMMQRDVG
jgi:ABC-2 type transport system permease protein